MKTNKFFATALAVLALAGFTACEPDTPTTPLELTESSVTLKVGETHQLTANVAVESWTSSNEAVATVADGLVTAVSAGNAIISATAAGVTKTCVVLVEADQTQGGTGKVKGTKVWPIILDGDAYAANESKIVASFQPNDVDQFLYVWENTYTAGNGDGINSLGNSGYTSLITGTVGWSGCGFCLLPESAGATAIKELCADIAKNPDQYALHMAIKSTDDQSHTFYIMGTDQTKFVLGSQVFDGGTILSDFPRDGSWHEFDIELSAYAAAIASSATPETNLFVALSGGNPGKQLNLDAVYFYKK